MRAGSEALKAGPAVVVKMVSRWAWSVGSVTGRILVGGREVVLEAISDRNFAAVEQNAMDSGLREYVNMCCVRYT